MIKSIAILVVGKGEMNVGDTIDSCGQIVVKKVSK